MSRVSLVKISVSITVLELEMRLCLQPIRRAKLQALWLVARGAGSRLEIARLTGMSVSALRLLVTRFNGLGMDCLTDARVANARPRVVPEIVLPDFLPLNAKSVQHWVLKEYGLQISLSTAWRWLHRADTR